MEALPNVAPARRRRYLRHAGSPVTAPTPIKLSLLRYTADYRIVSVGQLARLAALTPKSVRHHMRPLFDAGLVHVVAVGRAALSEPGVLNEASLLFGSAPNLYQMTKAGLRLLEAYGLCEAEMAGTLYGPRNTLFLAHELGIGDFHVWLEVTTREAPDRVLERWNQGPAAIIDLNRAQAPTTVRPDAWFVYKLGSRVLVGMVEIDTGTERGETRWKQKIAAYQSLFASGQLQKTTGYVNARVLVVASTARRRDALCTLIAQHATSPLAQRFWLADASLYKAGSFAANAWRQPGSSMLYPLVGAP